MTPAEEIARLREENKRLRDALSMAIPIVSEAFWDHHTAGTMPGTGYNHKVYREVSRIFGWRDSKKFHKWEKLIAQSRAKDEPGERE
jgi:hypothetical protein